MGRKKLMSVPAEGAVVRDIENVLDKYKEPFFEATIVPRNRLIYEADLNRGSLCAIEVHLEDELIDTFKQWGIEEYNIDFLVTESETNSSQGIFYLSWIEYHMEQNLDGDFIRVPALHGYSFLTTL